MAVSFFVNVVMPYSGPNDPDLPKDIQERPEEEREVFSSTFNSVWDECMEDGRTNESTCEERANAIARSTANDVSKGEIMGEETVKQTFSGPDDDALPDDVQDRPMDERRVFIETFNEAYGECVQEGGEPEDCDEAAASLARNAMEQVEEEGENSKANVVTDTISDKPWGDVDKTALGNKLAAGFAEGDVTRSNIEEVYAVLMDDAFVEEDGETVFQHTKGWGPHHEARGSGADMQIVLNRAGVGAAAAALGGARAEPNLSGQQLSDAKAHLRRHYRTHLDMDREEMPDSVKATLVEGWDFVKEGGEDPDWIKTMREELEELEQWAAGDDESSEEEEVIKTEDEQEDKMHGDYAEPPSRPFGGATSLAEVEEYEEAKEKERQFGMLWNRFQAAMQNIQQDPMVEDKVGATADLVSEFQNRLLDIKSIPVDTLLDALKVSSDEVTYEEIKANSDVLLEALTHAKALDDAKVGRRHRAGDMKRVQKAHDLMGELGAKCKMSHVPEEEMKKFLERANTPPELRKSDNGHDEESQQLFSFKHLIQAGPE